MNDEKKIAEQIRAQYEVKDASRLDELKKLDGKVKTPCGIFAYSFGTVGALVLGVGMCLAMKVIGDGSDAMMALGIVIGVVGIAGVSVNYPIYKKIREHGKKKYAFEIMQLAKEISED